MDNVYDTTEGYEFNVPVRLDLKLVGHRRGRSSVLQIFEDNSGRELCFSAKGTNHFIQGLRDKQIEVCGEYFNGLFIMRKQGCNARWDVVYEQDV